MILLAAMLPATFLFSCGIPEDDSAGEAADVHENAACKAAEALSERLAEARGNAGEDAPVMMPSYDTDHQELMNVAYSYDNALALMAFISEDNREDARALADAFVYAVHNDRSGHPRVRNAYAAGDISAEPGQSSARLPGWYDSDKGEWIEDRYQVGSNVGNTSYVALALLQYRNKYGGDIYLETARLLMDWVLDNCRDSGGDGFTGGFDGWEEAEPPVVYPLTYKSTEHNIDAHAAFGEMYGYTAEGKYYEAAKSADRFVESMYNENGHFFMTGTEADGVTPNTDVIALDAQVWCAMGAAGTFDEHEEALTTVQKMKTSGGGYSFCLENKNGGWWSEGTAFTALMYRERGDERKYNAAMKALEAIQLDSGLFPAATVDNLSTGIDLFDGSPWEYSRDPAVAPTAWFVMAVNDMDPYRFTDCGTG